MQRPRNPLLAFLLMVALLLPWLMFLFRPGGTNTGHVLFWFTLLFCLLLLWMMSANQRRLATAVGPDLGPRMLATLSELALAARAPEKKYHHCILLGHFFWWIGAGEHHFALHS